MTKTGASGNRYPDGLKGVLQAGTSLDGPSIHKGREWDERPVDVTASISSMAEEKAKSSPGFTEESAGASDVSERLPKMDLVENRRLRRQFTLELQWLRDKEDEEQRFGDADRANEYHQSAARVESVLKRLKRQVLRDQFSHWLCHSLHMPPLLHVFHASTYTSSVALTLICLPKQAQELMESSTVIREIVSGETTAASNVILPTQVDKPALEPEQTTVRSPSQLFGLTQDEPQEVGNSGDIVRVINDLIDTTTSDRLTSSTQSRGIDPELNAKASHPSDNTTEMHPSYNTGVPSFSARRAKHSGFEMNAASSDSRLDPKRGPPNGERAQVSRVLAGAGSTLDGAKQVGTQINQDRTFMRGKANVLQTNGNDNFPGHMGFATTTDASVLSTSTSQQFIKPSAASSSMFTAQNANASAPALLYGAQRDGLSGNGLTHSHLRHVATARTWDEDNTITGPTPGHPMHRIHVVEGTDMNQRILLPRQNNSRSSDSINTYHSNTNKHTPPYESRGNLPDRSQSMHATRGLRRSESIHRAHTSIQNDIETKTDNRTNDEFETKNYLGTTNGLAGMRSADGSQNDTASENSLNDPKSIQEEQTSKFSLADENDTDNHELSQKHPKCTRKTSESVNGSTSSLQVDTDTLSSSSVTENAVELKLQRTRSKLDRLKRQQAKAQQDKDHYRLAFTVVAIEETETLVTALQKKAFGKQKVALSVESSDAVTTLASPMPSNPGTEKARASDRPRTKKARASDRPRTEKARASDNLLARPTAATERYDTGLVVSGTDSDDCAENSRDSSGATAAPTVQEEDVDSFLSRIRKEMMIETPSVHPVQETGAAAAQNLENHKQPVVPSSYDGEKDGQHHRAGPPPIASVSDNAAVSSDAENEDLAERRCSFPTLTGSDQSSLNANADSEAHEVGLASRPGQLSRELASRHKDSKTPNVPLRQSQRVNYSRSQPNVPLHQSQPVNYSRSQRAVAEHEQRIEDQWDLLEAAAEMICRSESPHPDASSHRLPIQPAKDDVYKRLQPPHKKIEHVAHTATNKRILQRGQHGAGPASINRPSVEKQIRNKTIPLDQQFRAQTSARPQNQRDASRMDRYRPPIHATRRSNQQRFVRHLESGCAHPGPRTHRIESPQQHMYRPTHPSVNASAIGREESPSLRRFEDNILHQRPRGISDEDHEDMPEANSILEQLPTGPGVASPAGTSAPTPIASAKTATENLANTYLISQSTPITDHDAVATNDETSEHWFSLSSTKWPLDQFQTPIQRRVNEICADASLHSFGQDLHFRLAGFHHFNLEKDNRTNAGLLLTALHSQKPTPLPPPVRVTTPSMTSTITNTAVPVAPKYTGLPTINMDKLDTFVSRVPNQRITE